MEKNQTGKWTVYAWTPSSGAAVTGDAANITANIRIDGGAANAVDDTNPTELEDGYYVFDITAAESNGDMLTICPQSSTANTKVMGCPPSLHTRPANFNALGISSGGAVTEVNLTNTCTTNTDMRGTDSAYTGTPPTASSIRSEIDSNSTQLAAIVADTDELQTNQGNWLTATGFATPANVTASTGTIQADIAALNDLSAADVNAELDSALDTVISSPTAGSIADYIMRIKYTICNKLEVTEANGNSVIYNDVGASFSSITAAFSSDSTTTTRKKLI